MNVKQKYFENDNIVIKQENTFDVPLTEATKEAMDSFKNEKTYSFTTLNVKRDSQRSPGEVMFDFIYDVRETENSEVKAADLFVTPDDLHLLTQEVNRMEYIVPKAELLTEYCDLPTIKSDVEFLDKPSTSNKPPYTLEQPKLNGYKKKVNYFKNYSSSYTGLKHFNGIFWKYWQACEFCGHFYNKFNYFGHYFIHYVKTNFSTNAMMCKANKPTILKKHFKSNKSKARSTHYKRNRSVVKNSTVYTGQSAFECEICFKEFNQKYNLSVHLKIHTGEKQFKCLTCPKRFIRKNDLKRHLKIHTGDKPFNCKICSKQFIRTDDLNRHLKIHTGEKQFKCKICSKQFSQKCTLNTHLKIHSGEKPYKCNICLKQFTYKSTLNVHLKIHTGEKQYICNTCSKKFTHKNSLNYHLKIHTGEKQFKCKTCLKQFIRKGDLKRHLKIHTGEKSINV